VYAVRNHVLKKREPLSLSLFLGSRFSFPPPYYALSRSHPYRVGNAVLKQNVLTAARIFELANEAHFLYLTRNSVERGRLLKSVLLNCVTDGVSLSPTQGAV
jgi:hypothetical protein